MADGSVLVRLTAEHVKRKMWCPVTPSPGVAALDFENSLARTSEPGIRTFLIADVRGYTRYTQEHGDEAAARLAASFADVIESAVADSDGRLVELRGDDALVVFSSPRTLYAPQSGFSIGSSSACGPRIRF